MPTFNPPTDLAVPPIALDRRDLPHPLSNRLFRHYSARARGRNVFLMKDGSITEQPPVTTYTEAGTIDTFDWDRVEQVWWGGHVAEIDDVQAAALTEAGYGSYIT